MAEEKLRGAFDSMNKFMELLRTGKSGKDDWAAVLGMKPEKYDRAIEFVREAGRRGIIPLTSVASIVPRLRHGKALALARKGRTAEALLVMTELHKRSPEDLSFLSDYLVLLSWNGEWRSTVHEYSKLDGEMKAKLPTYAALEVATALKNTGKYDEATRIIKKIIAAHPKNAHAWLLLGAIHKRRREFMSAFRAFARSAELSKGGRRAVDAKYRLLADVMAVGAARDLLRKQGDKVSPEILELLNANEAALRIQWKEPKKAIRLLDRNLREAGVANPERPTRDELENAAARRSFFDRILAYNYAKEMKRAVRDIDLMKEYGIETPVWLAGAAADSLLYVRRPEEALAICDEAIAKLAEKGMNRYPDNFEPSLMKFYALVDLERHDEAKKLMDNLAETLPSYALKNGVYRKNWDAVTVLMEDAWWYNYNNQPDVAAEKFEELLDKAPNNSDFLSGLAYSHYYRGWPRMALDEFAVAKTIEPDNLSPKVGYCRTLNELDGCAEARRMAAELAKKKPKDLRVQRLKRDLELQEMRVLSLDMEGSTTNWDTWFNVTMKLEQPIEPYRSVYAKTKWMYRKRNHGEEKKGYKAHLVRGWAGADWRLSRDWWGRASISFPLDGTDDVGGAVGLTYKDDYWTVSTDFDSRTTDMPSQALHQGLYGMSWSGSVNYRTSEKFNATVSYRNLYLSDHNDMNQFDLNLDRQIYTSAHVEARLALLNNLEMWKRKEPEIGYYSPRLAYTCQLAPMIEHTWYKRYETSFTNRLTCGGGLKTEKHYGISPAGFVKFEEDCRFTDTFGILVGSTVSYDTEDGDGSMGLAFFMKLRWMF
jgi:tetratricopeptide (TPR) repeat protein